MKNLGTYNSFNTKSFGLRKKKTRFVVIEEDSSDGRTNSISFSNVDEKELVS